MGKKKEVLYQSGKIKQLVEGVARMAAKTPELAQDSTRLHASLAAALPGYGDKGSCFNCGHSMEVAEYTAGIVEGILLLKMAAEVRHRATKMGFTEANMVHVPTLATSDGVRHHITIASYLGLVAQPPKMKSSGYWVITHWGWKLLRGEDIPRSTRFWRGKLIDRSVEMTNLGQMFKTHTDLVARALAQRRKVQSDYRSDIGSYSPSDWVDFGGYAEEVVPAPKKEEPAGEEEPWYQKM